MTDYSEDNDETRRLDDIIRAAWPHKRPTASFAGDELERKGLMALYENEVLCVLASTVPPRNVVFRGTLDEAVAWVAQQPDAEPPKYRDPNATIRADVSAMISTIAAGAAAKARKQD
ncbi:hypothetical protein [Ensifer adhaerens]|uniref:hypothetical protein n=1 Tax=Ensifer adhaerens TaxID=106592 RepID=UPI00156867C6|nr:hypothetical protein [Ensifer adhaerens]